MTINTAQELRYAQGMLERRLTMVAELDNAVSQKQALMNHQDICGAVREVRRHRQNILDNIDDKSALHGRQVTELLKTVEHWLDMSRVVLGKWGVGDADIQRMEGGLL